MQWLRGWRLIAALLAVLVLGAGLGSFAWLTDTSGDERIQREAERRGIDLACGWPPAMAVDPDAVAALMTLTDLPQSKPPRWDGAPTQSLRDRQSSLTRQRSTEIANIVVRLGHHPNLSAHKGARAMWMNARLLMLESVYVAPSEDLPFAIEASLASVGDRHDAFTLAHALAWRIDDLRQAGIRPAFEPLIARLLDAYRDERLYLSARNVRHLFDRRESLFSERHLYERWMGEPVAREILNLMVDFRDRSDPTTQLQRWRAADANKDSTMLLSRADHARWLVAQNELRDCHAQFRAIMAIEALRSALLDLPASRDRCDVSGAPLKPLVRDGVVIGAYSIGVDLVDHGGDRARDIVLPLTPALATEMIPP